LTYRIGSEAIIEQSINESQAYTPSCDSWGYDLGCPQIMDFSQNYIFLGVGVAISVLGFFLKKEARKTQQMDEKLQELGLKIEKNDVRDSERWTNAYKLLEDRREDIKSIFSKLEEKKRR
jgi:low affinity Fe/Cu permease